MTKNTIQFDAITVRKLKIAYKKALLSNTEHFTFENNILLTNYAKYLIQYLETKGLK